MNMTAKKFCRCIERRIEDALAPLYIKVVIHEPRRLRFDPAGFCHFAMDSHISRNGRKRQFATTILSVVRSEVTGDMVDSFALSLISKILKEYAFYSKMHMDAVITSVRDANRILSEIS